jgi:mono/diheme cytochrome c family protein
LSKGNLVAVTRFGTRLFVVALVVGASIVGPGEAAFAAAAKTPSYTAAQAGRGAELYSAQCAMCHGDGLDDGQFAPPLKGTGFSGYWGAKTAGDVLTYINTMMPPTDPGGAGAQGNADIFAYILKVGGAPAGDKEVPTDPAALAGAAYQ